MSFALIIVGVILIVTAVRDTQGCLIQTVQGDFTGQGNFTYWVAAILILGALGYSDTLRPLSTGLLVLILLALFLTRGKQGLFNNLTAALQSSPGSTSVPNVTSAVSNTVSNLTSGLL